jgi:hypothetical protein
MMARRDGQRWNGGQVNKMGQEGRRIESFALYAGIADLPIGVFGNRNNGTAK